MAAFPRRAPGAQPARETTKRSRTLGRLLAAAALAHLSLTSAAGATDLSTGAAGTEDVIASVASVARNLRLTNVPDTIEVRADHLEFDFEKGRLEYRGRVEVTHAGVTIRADELTVSFTPHSARRLERIDARGDVRVEHGEETAAGGSAVYDPVAQTIVLSGDARLGSGPNTLSGETVIVYLKEGRASVQGGPPPDDDAPQGEGAADKRVRVVIMPDSINDIDDPLRLQAVEENAAGAAPTDAGKRDTEAPR